MVETLEELQKSLKGEVLTDESSREQYSHDASIFELKPQIIMVPQDTKDIQNIIKFVGKNKGFSLTARAAGTDMSGGPLTESIVLSLTQHINSLKKIEGLQATVEPGLYYRDFEKELDVRGLMFPSYPASKSLCALGGIIANNSGGEKSLTYGQTVHHVKRLKTVLADGNVYEFGPLTKTQLRVKMKKKTFEGEIYRKMYALCENNYDLIKSAEPKVSKNSSGYLLWKIWDRKTFDLSKLFVGSQGTLGIWVEADIELVKKKAYSRLVVASLSDLAQIGALLESVEPYKPESLESFDRHTLKLGIQFMPEIAKKINKSVVSFLWGFRREAERALFHGLPLLTILVELTDDNEEELQRRAIELGKELSAKHISNLVMRNQEEGEKYWIMRRESFNLLRQRVKDKHATPFIDDFSVQPEKLSEFLPKLYALLEKYHIQPTLAGHVGDGNFHIIPLMDLRDPTERDKIPLVLEEFAKLVKEYDGTMTAEHNDGLIRTPYLERQFGPEVVNLFKQVKAIFDKKNIFNPGKKVYGDIAFALAHIKKT
jgi:FAD/FMN-containing dehydrogenase